MKRITSISVSGFKSIGKEQNLKICPLTIIAGANSGGKSSFLQPLLIIKQTLESAFEPGALLINGANVKFSEITQLFSKNINGKQKQKFTLKFFCEDNQSITIIYKNDKKYGLVIEKAIVYEKDFRDKLVVSNKTTLNEVLSSMPKDFNILIKSLLKNHILFSVVNEKSFLKLDFRSSDKKRRIGPGFKLTPLQVVEQLCKDLIHLPGLRGNPERSYEKASVGSNFPGTFQNYAASIISSWEATNNKKMINALENSLKVLGLTCKVDARKVNDTNIEIRVSRSPMQNRSGCELINIADMGLGLSQMLPILVALLVAKKDQYVFLEQPEIHLHPQAQWELSKIFVDAAKKGIILIVETHSSLIIRGIQTLIAKGEIEAQKVSFNWFNRDKKTGYTVIDNAKLDKYGAFGDWPEDFDCVSLNAEQEYLDAVSMSYEQKK